MADAPAPFVPQINFDDLYGSRRDPSLPPSPLVPSQPAPNHRTFPDSPFAAHTAASHTKFMPDFLPPAALPQSHMPDFFPDSPCVGGGDMLDVLMESRQSSSSTPPSVCQMRLRGGNASVPLTFGERPRSRFATLAAHSLNASPGSSGMSSPSMGMGTDESSQAMYFSPDAPVMASRRLGGSLVRSHTNSPATSSYMSSGFSSASSSVAQGGFSTPVNGRPSPTPSRLGMAGGMAALPSHMMATDSPAQAMRSLSIGRGER